MFYPLFLMKSREEEKSLWLRNEAFKVLMRAWPKWSKWIPIDNCGLHKKFKMNTGVLYFLVKGIENLQSNPKKLKKLNKKINEIKYCTLFVFVSIFIF